MFNVGIGTEAGDTIHIHLSPKTRLAIVFSADQARRAAQLPGTRVVSVRPDWADGLETARGALVSIDVLRPAIVPIPEDILRQSGLGSLRRSGHSFVRAVGQIASANDRRLTSVEVGRIAEKCAMMLLAAGVLRFPVFARPLSDRASQYAGVDLLASVRFQVKLDWDAGPISDGGSGNIFVQLAEAGRSTYREERWTDDRP